LCNTVVLEGSGADIARYLLQQATKLGAQYGTAEVSGLDLRAFPKKVVAGSELYLTRTLIIATGSRPRRLEVPGEQKYWGRGVSFCSTCDAPFFEGKPIVVIGGGESALQESEFLLRYVSHLTILQDLDHLTATPALRDRVLSHSNVRLIFNTLVREIRGNAQVNALEIEDRQSGARQEIPVKGVFIFIGLVPSTQLVEGQLDLDDQGYIVTTPRMETRLAGVYAAGDVRRGAPRQIVTAAADGAVAALSAAEWLRDQTRTSAELAQASAG
jgi:thioredoxin reductase (NADPH)